MSMTALDIYKAQAQVLVPLARQMIAELGQEKARTIINKALGDHFRKWGAEYYRSRNEKTFGDKIHAAMDMFADGDALDWTIHEKREDGMRFDVTGCRYAEFYKEIGAQDLGFLLVCSQDVPITEGFGEGAKLERTQTIMQGASHCNFHWYQQSEGKEPKREKQ